MRKIVFGTSLLMSVFTAGCTSPQWHQSLLIHENRQLEDALYVAQAQVTDLRRENDLLREQRASGFSDSPDPSRSDPWNDIIPPMPFEVPKVLLEDSGTTDVPESLRGSQVIPLWTPVR